MLCTCQVSALESSLTQTSTDNQPAAGHSRQAQTTQYIATPCQFALPDTISGRALCSTTTFPVDYTEPGNSSTISLHAVTIPGSRDSDTATVLLDGGPGGSGNAVLRLMSDPQFSQRLLALGDVVVLAQRGTRFSSQPLNCSGSHKDCIRKLQQTKNIDSFTTENSARDIVTFANERGYTGIRIVAYSYGTRLALQVARQAPDKVIAMALDSVIPLKTNHQDLRGIDDALIALDRECRKSEDCREHVTDSVVESFLESLANLASSPIIVPGALGSLKLTPQVFLERVVNGIQAGHTLKYIPRFISEISNSRPGLISRDLLNGPGIGISHNNDLAVGLLMAINCSDIVNVNDHRIDQTMENLKTDISGEAAMTGLSILGNLLTRSIREQGARCKSLPGSGLPAVAAAMDSNQIFDGPALLISGEFDPIAPDDNATQVQQQLSDESLTVLFPGISHAVAFESHCARSLIASFFEDTDDELNLDCISNRKIAFPAGNGFVVQR